MFGLSYSASFASLPEQLVYCEHGNQFDPSNTLMDYANPLDSPVGAHVVTELVRPIGSGIGVTPSVDLREVSYVFPLAAIPQWVAGRIFYRFLGQVLRWLLAPLVAVYIAYEGLAAVVRAFGGSLALRPCSSRWPTSWACWWPPSRWCSSSVAGQPCVRSPPWRRTSQGRNRARSGTARTWPSASSWRTTERHRRWPGARPPWRSRCSSPAIPTLPAMSELARADGRRTVIVNTGCWLRQLQPVEARLGGPPVFVPTFVHTHVRVRAGQDGLAVELWDHPRPADRQLPWIERAAIAGRTPAPPPPDAEPRLMARSVVARGARRPS